MKSIGDQIGTHTQDICDFISALQTRILKDKTRLQTETQQHKQALKKVESLQYEVRQLKDECAAISEHRTNAHAASMHMLQAYKTDVAALTTCITTLQDLLLQIHTIVESISK